MKPTPVILMHEHQRACCRSCNAAMIIQVQKLANASLGESFNGDPSAFGQAMTKQCQNRKRAEFDAIQGQKPLKA